jgi:progressive ankylosis protein
MGRLHARFRNQLSAKDTLPERVSLRDAYRFFGPLLLMAELMMISHAVIAGSLARMPDPVPVIAAYSIAFFFHTTFGSPLWACQIVSISFIPTRASVRRMLMFSFFVMCAIGWAWVALGVTPLGDWLFGGVFGLGPKVVPNAKDCILVMTLMLPTVLLRSVMYALMMRARKTLLVTYGTIIRLVALAVSLWLLTDITEGAVVGAWALISCIALETIFAVAKGWPLYRALPEQDNKLASYKEIWLFAWPIMIMHATEHGVNFVMSLFLARLPRPDIALAVFSVVDSVAKVLLSPLRNLTVTVQSLLSQERDLSVLVVFCLQITGIFAVFMGLFFLPPLNDFALISTMGLTPELADYAGIALGIGVGLALTTGAAASARGILIACRATTVLALSSAVRLSAVIAVGFVAIALDVGNGAVVGMAALTAAFGTEAIVLIWRILQLQGREQMKP